MKANLLTLILLILIFQTASIVRAQVEEKNQAPNEEYVEVKEGNLIYLKSGPISSPMYQRPETKDLKGKTYKRFYLDSEKFKNDQLFLPIVRSVFSKERAKQLMDTRLSCIIGFNPVDKKIIQIKFVVRATDDRLSIKLSELYELEKKFLAEPNLIPFTHWGEIVEPSGELITLPHITFSRLYE